MCGISGVVSHYCKQNNIEHVKKSIKKLNHRGPDYSNIWHNEDGSAVFGHARLAIRDLSSSSNQPIISDDGRYVLIYNGELYNCDQILDYIGFSKKNFSFNNSDTQVLIKSIQKIGVNETLKIIEGMFAFAVWDKKNYQLFLARDKTGQKPIYYTIVNNSIFFASEINAIPNFFNLEKKISKESIKEFVNFSYIKSPKTVYENIYQVNPSSFVEISNFMNLKEEKLQIKKHKYSQVKFREKFTGSFENAQIKLDNLIHKSVKSHIISDVPVGVFLSGGIDSSLIASIASIYIPGKIKTFSVGFEEQEFDETYRSKAISKSIGAEHNEIFLSEKKIIDIIEKLHSIFNDPFADSSQIPTIFLSQFTKKEVTVALTGDAGDELFGGYNRHVYSQKIYNIFSLIGVEKSLWIAKVLENSFKNNSFLKKIIIKIIKICFNISQPRDKIFKLSKVLSNIENFHIFYETILMVNNFGNSLFINQSNTRNNYIENIHSKIDINNLLLEDFNDYLPNDILCKVDRCSMHSSLETRIPFLDQAIVDFAFTLDSKYKVKNRENKIILRKLLEKYLPKNLIYKQKTGFGIPLNKWFNGFLFKYIDNLFLNHKFENDYGLDNTVALKVWEEFKYKKYGNEKLIWNIVVLKQWDIHR